MTLTGFANNSVDICMDNIVFNVSSLPPPTHHLIAKDQMILMSGCIRIQKTNNKLSIIKYC
jgi:hypothetical protein